MNKIFLIIQREYLSRVKKKSFLLMTVLGPLLMAGALVLIVWMGLSGDNRQNILVVDDNYPIFENLPSNDNIKFNYTDIGLEGAKKLFHESDYSSILYLPKNILSSNKAMFYFKKQPNAMVQKSIENKVEKLVEEIKLKNHHIAKEDFYQIKTNFNLSPYKFKKVGEEEKVDKDVAYVGFAFAIVIYLFIMMYGVQVMRGVIEEKSNRIVEIIISSVKPFQLMMGKIVGVAMVGLTQFVLWILLTIILFSVAQTVLFQDSFDPSAMQESMQMTSSIAKDIQQEQAMKALDFNDPTNLINRINFPLMIGMFLFYFLGGYLLYSALFAAVGAAVDNETETQQFIMPVTMPLTASYLIANFVVQNPEGPAAFWFSIIPFTSPIIMMIRVAIGIESGDIWQLYLSMFLLIVGFIFTTWLASKIYRTGILMYGKKASYKELWKWLQLKK